jgi:pyruvate kinase
LPEAGIVTKVGQKVTFDTSLKDYAGKAIPVDHKELHKFIKKDHRILIDDGRVEAVTLKVAGTVVTAKIVQADIIKSHKGINLPDSHVAIPALSDKDKSDLHFGVLASCPLYSAHCCIALAQSIETFSAHMVVDPQSPILLCP